MRIDKNKNYKEKAPDKSIWKRSLLGAIRPKYITCKNMKSLRI